MFAILHPLAFLRKTRMPLCLVGFPYIVYLENNCRCRFFNDTSLVSHKWVSITILMSLVRLRKVCSLFSSLYVPVFVPLRLVEVIVILLAEFDLKDLILF